VLKLTTWIIWIQRGSWSPVRLFIVKTGFLPISDNLDDIPYPTALATVHTGSQVIFVEAVGRAAVHAGLILSKYRATFQVAEIVDAERKTVTTCLVLKKENSRFQLSKIYLVADKGNGGVIKKFSD
jgi:hypothetical protein